MKPNVHATPSWYLDPLVAAQKRRVHQEWIRRKLSARDPGIVLKTDLFEEAYGDDRIFHDLFPSAQLSIGMDLNSETARIAARRNAPAIVAMACDARFMALPTACVDTIVSTSTLDHFQTEVELGEALDELMRVLRPGGVFLITLDNPRNPGYHVVRWGSRRGWAPFELGYTASLKRLKAALGARGLHIEGEEYLLHNPRGVSTVLFLGLRKTLGRFANLPIRMLLAAFSLFGKIPTRSITGCFLAVCAIKSIEGDRIA